MESDSAHLNQAALAGPAATFSATAVAGALPPPLPPPREQQGNGQARDPASRSWAPHQGPPHALVTTSADSQPEPNRISKRLKDVDGCNAENRMLFFAKVLRSATEGEVKALFSPYGRVYDVNLFRAFQGAPTTKGCGLVTMGSHDEAQAAIDALDNKYVWDGMEFPMVVKWMDAALQRRRREQHLAAMRSGLIPSHSMGSASTMPDNWLPTGFALANMLPHSRGAALGLPAASMLAHELEAQENPPVGCQPDAIKLFVGNIPKSCTEQQLLPFFETVGKVVELVIVRDKTFHESKGSAFVWYATRALAERAILQFNLRHVLPDPTGEQTRPLVVRKAKIRASPVSALPMALAGLGGADPRLMDPSLHMQPGAAPMSMQPFLAGSVGSVGQGMLATGLDSLSPHSAGPQHGLAMAGSSGYGLPPMVSGTRLLGMPTTHGRRSQANDSALYDAYGSGSEPLDTYLHGPSSSNDGDQVIMSAAVSQHQLSLVNSHLFSIQSMSGAQLNIMIGAPGMFHLVVSGNKAQVDSARALLYSVMEGS